MSLYEVRAEVGADRSNRSAHASQVEALARQREEALHRMYTAILKVLDSAGLRLHVLDPDNIAGMERVLFSVMATRRAHARMLGDLRASDAADQVVAFQDPEGE